MLTQVTSHILSVPLSNDKNPTQSVVPLECGVAVVPERARWIRSELVEGEKFTWREGALGHHFLPFLGRGCFTWGDGALRDSWNPVSPLGALLVLPVPVDACSILSFIFHLMIIGSSLERILEECL